MVKIFYFVLCCVFLTACCSSYREASQLSTFAGILGDTTVVKDYSVSYYGNGKNMDVFLWGATLEDYPFYKTYQKYFCNVSCPEVECGCPYAFPMDDLVVSVYLKADKTDSLILLKEMKMPFDKFKRIVIDTEVSLGRVEGKIPPRKFVHFDYKKSQSMYVDALKDTVFYYTSMEGANIDSAYNGWTRIE